MNEERIKNLQIKVKGLHDPVDDDLKSRTTPAERWDMMWQLAQDAWAFKGESVAEPKLHRHIVRVFRRER